MTSLSLPFHSFALPSWRRPSYFVLYNLLGWGLLCAFVALAIYSDNLRVGVHTHYTEIFVQWCANALVLAPLSWILYFASVRWEAQFNQLHILFVVYLLSFLFLLPWHVFSAVTALLWATKLIPFWDRVIAFQNAVCLFRCSSITAVFFAVVGLRLWQQNQARMAALSEQREQSLRLSLDLEQQSLAALKAQLEPHFMFNALNALSALVRSSESDKALGAIEKLSELLRYALSSGEKTWVSMEEEIRFVQDYLSLQKLRFGDRMQVQILGAEDKVLACSCPPLLLQPLMENALRHDLECYKGVGDIVLAFHYSERGLRCIVSNPVHEGFTVKAGFGLGLKTLRARLASLYQGRARLHTAIEAGRFSVEIFLPHEN
jgi:two-component system sensor histidine kinase AlgZ